MKIATWNVNSLRVRLGHVLDWLAGNAPDVLALQETKLTDDQFPTAALAEAGYRSLYAGEKTYNGVALLSRRPASDSCTSLPGLEDPARRVLAATVDGVRVVNLYVVNGQEVGSDKYRWKLRWLEAVHAFLAAELQVHPRLIVLGDFNIAPEDRDVYDPQAWHERILCSSPERAALGRLRALGLHDTFRLFEQPDATFSWWDYRAGGFRRNHGLRIDLILASEALKSRCRCAGVDRAPRALERPSDHAPVVARFDLEEPA